ncbi:MAG: hypothetical protein AABY22_03680 [Nanoarchaeota archaeon]
MNKKIFNINKESIILDLEAILGVYIEKTYDHYGSMTCNLIVLLGNKVSEPQKITLYLGYRSYNESKITYIGDVKNMYEYLIDHFTKKE